jgi:hypothetical protein
MYSWVQTVSWITREWFGKIIARRERELLPYCLEQLSISGTGFQTDAVAHYNAP